MLHERERKGEGAYICQTKQTQSQLGWGPYKEHPTLLVQTFPLFWHVWPIQADRSLWEEEREEGPGDKWEEEREERESRSNERGREGERREERERGEKKMCTVMFVADTLSR